MDAGAFWYTETGCITICHVLFSVAVIVTVVVIFITGFVLIVANVTVVTPIGG